MQQIRENIWFVTDGDLGKPIDKGPAEVSGLGEVFIDIADLNYINDYRSRGIEPAFFVSKTDALNGCLVVVSRQHAA